MEIPDAHKETLKDIVTIHYRDVLEFPSDYVESAPQLVAVLKEGEKLCGVLGIDWQALVGERTGVKPSPYDTKKPGLGDKAL